MNEELKRYKEPDQDDKERLDEAVKTLMDATLCDCGENGACDRCGQTVGDILLPVGVDHSKLRVTLTLKDRSHNSRLATRYNTNERFAEAVDAAEEYISNADNPEDALAYIREAATELAFAYHEQASDIDTTTGNYRNLIEKAAEKVSEEASLEDELQDADGPSHEARVKDRYGF